VGHRPSPPGDVRGFDVVTGACSGPSTQWRKKEGEPGVGTWEKEPGPKQAMPTVWAPMSADEELGYVYLPVSTPTNDYYGGHRRRRLMATVWSVSTPATGKKVWHDSGYHGCGTTNAGAPPPDRHHRRGKGHQGGRAKVTKQAFV